ncbi:cell division ATP-binding protein FtsE [Proteinivorax hydrogeniformans]|uniref:Cell division ATP-binding protein FtsE n=1 Tax=Proteinivorax hydrogeniformans TaxID=1826727 RepID=A0AAU8HUY9_9FIRM
MLIFQNVEIRYKSGNVAVSNINFKVDKGEFVYIVGPSGAGKSSLLKAVFKEVEPKKGEIFLFNRNITRLKRREIPHLRRQVGVVFQDFRLLEEKNVYDNIAFALRVIGASRKEIKTKVLDVLKIVGLEGKGKRYPNQISGGEQQRVALARALVNKPEIIVCDEPTGNLDPTTSDEIMDILNKINLRGTTIVMATHAKDIVDKYRNRVIAVQDGSIVRDDAQGGYSDVL